MPTKAKTVSKPQKLDKWHKIFTPQIIIAAILCIFCTIMAIVCLLNSRTKEISVTSPVENMKPLDAITPKDCIEQKFTADNDYTRFGLYYANFANYIQGGTLHIDIVDSSGTKMQSGRNIAGILDNSFLYFDYPLQKDETYTITIYLTDNAQGITFFTTTADNYDAELFLNKNPQSSSIIMAFTTETKDSFAAWYYVMIIALTLCYIVLKINKDAYAEKS